MLATWILTEGDREILRGGEVLLPASGKSPHIAAMDILYECLRDRLDRGHWWRSTQGPPTLGEGDLPEPDLSMVQDRRQTYAGRSPGGRGRPGGGGRRRLIPER